MGDILNAILYAAGLPNSSGTLPVQRADIINLSLGGLDPSGEAVTFFQDAINQIRQAGVLIVASAGNESTSIPSAPAACPGVLSVSAVDLNGDLAPYSNYGNAIDIAAPGGNVSADLDGDGHPDGVLSTLPDEQREVYAFRFYDGTSMAAPHVAGLAALCIAANPNLTVNQLEDVILSTATDIGDPGRDDLYGHGLINAAAAVQQAAGIGATHSFEVFPNMLNFGSDKNQLEISIVSTGTDSLEIDSPMVETYDGTAWLSATIASNSGLGIVVSVDRTGLAVGRYAGRITLSSNYGDQVVEVNMEVSSGQTLPDIGTVYILLVNPDTGETMGQADTNQNTGFNYLLNEVNAGTYILVAGTDNNDNGTICEIDDFCGAYPVFNEPTIIDVPQTGSLTDLNFPLSYLDSGIEAAVADSHMSTLWEVMAADGVNSIRRLR